MTLGVAKDSQISHQTHEQQNEKLEKVGWTSSKLKLCFKGYHEESEDTLQNGRKLWQTIYQIKDFYPEYKKKPSQLNNKKAKQLSCLKVGKGFEQKIFQDILMVNKHMKKIKKLNIINL